MLSNWLKFLISVLFLTLSSFGCAYLRYLPDDYTDVRIHPSLGFVVYNQSEKREVNWEEKFSTITSAYSYMKDCIGVIAPEVEGGIRAVPIVIVPSEALLVLFFQDAWGVTDLNYIFIREDGFRESTLRGEWLHIYLYLTGKRYFGDPFHRDILFNKCVYRKFAAS